MLDFRLLGTAAGGGVPQWNCACILCSLCRSDTGRVAPRLQAQATFSSDGQRWFLINASPDLRVQIERNTELQPYPVHNPAQGRRNTPICGILLTSADLDQVLGLFLLREFQPITIYATHLVRQVLEANPFMRMFNRIPNQLTWVEVFPSVPFLLDGVSCTPVPLSGSLPYYAREFDSDEPGQATIGLVLEWEGRRIAYTPSVAAIGDELRNIYGSCDVVLVDGTFWSDSELSSTHVGTPLGRSIGHVPMSGADGTIARLANLTSPRKVFVHINNTNPVLDCQSIEYRFVRDHGWEVGWDGWRLS